MPLYLRKSELRRVGEWFLALRDRASSWMVIFGFMAVFVGIELYFMLCWWLLYRVKGNNKRHHYANSLFIVGQFEVSRYSLYKQEIKQ